MYQAPHEPRDQEKLKRMMGILKSGKSLPPIIVCGEIAFSGSHRLAAYEAMGYEMSQVPVISISENDIESAMRHIGLDPMYDAIDNYNEFEETLVELNII